MVQPVQTCATGCCHTPAGIYTMAETGHQHPPSVDFCTVPSSQHWGCSKNHLSLVPSPPHSAPLDIPSPQIHFIDFKHHPIFLTRCFLQRIFFDKLSSPVDSLLTWPQPLQTAFHDPQWVSNHPHDCFSVIITAHPTRSLYLLLATYFSLSYFHHMVPCNFKDSSLNSFHL